MTERNGATEEVDNEKISSDSKPNLQLTKINNVLPKRTAANESCVHDYVY